MTAPRIVTPSVGRDRSIIGCAFKFGSQLGTFHRQHKASPLVVRRLDS